MKTNLLVVLVGVLFMPFQCIAQLSYTTPMPEYNVTLVNGQSIYGKEVMLQNPLASTAFVSVDKKKKFEANQVKSFYNKDGYFVFENLPGKNKPMIFKKEQSGKVNLYAKTIWSFGTYEFSDELTEQEAYESEEFQTAQLYFSVKNAPLRKVNYRNLKMALSDNPSSAEALKKAQRLRILNTASMILGGALIATDVYRFAASPEKSRGFMPLMITGGLMMTIPAITSKAKHRHYQRAINAYNTPQ